MVKFHSFEPDDGISVFTLALYGSVIVVAGLAGALFRAVSLLDASSAVNAGRAIRRARAGRAPGRANCFRSD